MHAMCKQSDLKQGAINFTLSWNVESEYHLKTRDSFAIPQKTWWHQQDQWWTLQTKNWKHSNKYCWKVQKKLNITSRWTTIADSCSLSLNSGMSDLCASSCDRNLLKRSIIPCLSEVICKQHPFVHLIGQRFSNLENTHSRIFWTNSRNLNILRQQLHI